MVSDVSLWTDEQKQKYYDAYLSGTVLFHKSANDEHTGVVLSLFYSETTGLNMSLLSGGWLYVYKIDTWKSKNLLNS